MGHRGCPSCLLPGPKLIRAGDASLACESLVEEAGEPVGSGMVGLPMKVLFMGKSLTVSRYYLALGGVVSPRPQVSKHQNTESKKM